MKFLLHTIQNIMGFVRRISDDHVSAFAAQSAYFILMSIIPILLLMMTMIRYLPINQTDLTNMIFAIVPETFQGMFSSIVGEVYSKSLAVVPLTAVFAAWSASKGILSLYGGLNTIYHVPFVPNYIVSRLLSALYTILFIIAILLTLVLMVFGTTIQEHLISHLPMIANVTGFFIHFRFLITLPLLTLVFLIMYVVLPNRRASFKSQIPGAVISAVSWMIFSFVFSLYVRYSKGFTQMYGSMTTIMFLMLWLYFCMAILLVGAEINAYFEDRFRRMRLRYLLEKENYKMHRREEREKRVQGREAYERTFPYKNDKDGKNDREDKN